ncbi:metalloprotease [Trichoderma gamsii]|uniref:Metalloprotease n=1 Tax=Trichoderma gamsii TaxID=398673 RepID=A0A0W7VXN4_9HYPO|nr:metalloprotease [Trichoderma gamsii]PNP47826.1 hypothetical protein TGAMA5MH_00878 [Trichoderma gamsii]PON24946.1 metalloprotease [Trichoderma gamsii]
MLASNLLLGASAYFGGRNWCGTQTNSPEFLSTVAALQASEQSSSAVHARQHAADANITIPVYMTAFVNTTNSQDILSDDDLKAQFDVLVDNYAPLGITFTLKNTTRIVNDDYARGFDYYNFNGIKAETKQGGYDTLNLYFVTNMDPTEWGWGSCTLPTSNITSDSLWARLDGCTLVSYTVPGGTNDGTTYKGQIAVHEVGHWLSLLHTFDGLSCDGPGDYIADTPQESANTLNVCPVGRDSCPDEPGLDPINNFMDYSGEGCWSEFTPGQAVRMANCWWTMRYPFSSV